MSMPPMSGMPCEWPPAPAFFSSTSSATIASVVSIRLATDAAFCSAERKAEKFVTCAAELVRFQPDVIVASGPEASIRAVQHATSTLPIVMVAIDYDPIALGYVAGLARPGGHITGVVFQQVELAAKRLEFLKEVLPQVTQVAVLWPPFAAD